MLRYVRDFVGVLGEGLGRAGEGREDGRGVARERRLAELGIVIENE